MNSFLTNVKQMLKWGGNLYKYVKTVYLQNKLRDNVLLYMMIV